jgi:hypothetical protein
MENNHIGVNAELDGSNRIDIEIEEDSESKDKHHCTDDESDDFEFNIADEDDGSVLQILPDGVDELWEAEIEDINDLGIDVSNDGYEDLDRYTVPAEKDCILIVRNRQKKVSQYRIMYC